MAKIKTQNGKKMEDLIEDMETWFEIILIRTMKDRTYAQRDGYEYHLSDYQNGKLVGICDIMYSANMISKEDLAGLGTVFVGDF